MSAPLPPYTEIIETNGIKVPFIPEIITPKIERPMRNNRYERGECLSLKELLQKGDRVLELGAGVGLLSSVAARNPEVEAVTAVEANPKLIRLIRETHRLNDALRVILKNGVVTKDDTVTLPFYIRKDFWASSMEPDSRPYAEKMDLPCFNINALVKDVNPTVIACDIEGGEDGLFDNVDLSGVRAMILEFHPKVYGVETQDAIIKMIDDQGLKVVPIKKPSSVRVFLRENVDVVAKENVKKAEPKQEEPKQKNEPVAPTVLHKKTIEITLGDDAESQNIIAKEKRKFARKLIRTGVIPTDAPMTDAATAPPEPPVPSTTKAVEAKATNRGLGLKPLLHLPYPLPAAFKSRKLDAINWPPKDPRIVIMTCMKDEGPFILEWLAWHKSIGINNFVIFTNDCSDGTVELLNQLEDMGELRHLPNPALATEDPRFQPIMLRYINHMRDYAEADYFISMDVDEFIDVQHGDGHMRELFKRSGPFDVISMSELNHGSNRVEAYEPGLMVEQFPGHQSTRPGGLKSRRGVKSIVHLNKNLIQTRNHRPDFTQENPVRWLDGSLRPLTSLHADPTENGIDVRGSYNDIVMHHYPLRSLHSYLVKMFRGDVVVKDKMVSQRYWRQRDHHEETSYDFKRQEPAFKAKLKSYMADKTLRQLHEASCAKHKARIDELLKLPLFQERIAWIRKEVWDKSEDK
ncbi:MAG: FkbM family methyltransferase [Halocynthiibacter sp.]